MNIEYCIVAVSFMSERYHNMMLIQDSYKQSFLLSLSEKYNKKDIWNSDKFPENSLSLSLLEKNTTKFEIQTNFLKIVTPWKCLGLKLISQI